MLLKNNMAETTSTYPMQPSDRSMYSSKPATIEADKAPAPTNAVPAAPPAPPSDLVKPQTIEVHPLETPVAPHPAPVTIL
jgi:hypothetical protein